MQGACDSVLTCVSLRTVLEAVKAWPGNAGASMTSARRPALTASARGAPQQAQAGTKERRSRHEQRNCTKREPAMF